MRRPSVLALLGVVVMAVSAAFVAGLFASPSEPAGAIASDTVTIAVGRSSSFPITGAQWGLVAGAVLLITALAWHLALLRAPERSRDEVSR